MKFKGKEVHWHSSWKAFFERDDIQKMIEDIECKIDDNFTPSADKVFRFAEVDLKKLKVVILGQDPYPQEGVATGRAFEVNGWDQMGTNISLQNIMKLICKSDHIPNIEEVRTIISTFPSPKEFFDNWEKQGVLLLNTSLTCKINESNSHKNFWKKFSVELIQFLNTEAPEECIWLLWGNKAKKSGKSVNIKFESAHPRLHSQKTGSFLGEDHFAKINDIHWKGNF